MNNQRIEKAIVRAMANSSFGKASDSFSVEAWMAFVEHARDNYSVHNVAHKDIANIMRMIDDIDE